jgi:predicted DsbA family dithiol-disulfide isomerase
MKERLLQLHLVDAEPIGDRDVLAGAAAAVGLDRAEVDAVLAGDAYADAVRDDERRAVELEVTGVPFFLVDGRMGIPGAQDTELLLRVLQRAWDSSVEASVADRADAACSDDGCAI